MIVRRSDFTTVLEQLKAIRKLSCDTETTGLRPYHSDRLFSLILGTPDQGFYFNFQAYQGLQPEFVLLPAHMESLKNLFVEQDRTWYFHNAKFDLAMLAREGIEVAGEIHCTKAQALVEYNEHQSYDLAACAGRIGLKKSEAVEEYVMEHGLWEWENIPGKKKREKKLFYDRVPFEIIAPYGETDGHITCCLGLSQEAALKRIADETPAHLPNVLAVAENERRLTRTVFNMERLGVRGDREYCVRAARYEADRAAKATEAFKAATGRDFKNSGKLFEAIFASERDKWEYTEEGNPSFKAHVLEYLDNPAARIILQYRDAKSKSDFYHGFLYHMDRDDRIHPKFDPDGTITGRFSSSNPNFQNLTSEKDMECLSCGKEWESAEEENNSRCPSCEGERVQLKEYLVRRAIIPTPGFVLFMPDYSQMEYRLMLEYAARAVRSMTPLVQKVLDGMDVHQAMADEILRVSGHDLGRSKAKNCNFAKLYGAGKKKFSKMIGGTLQDAARIMGAMDKAAPEVEKLIDGVMSAAEQRKFIFNWFGRICRFPNPRFAYAAPNYLIQGGCADVNKIALNQIDDALQGMKSRLIMTIHDENPCEIHESEINTAPKMIKEIMESVFPYKYLPLTCSAEWSPLSLADKRKGFPC